MKTFSIIFSNYTAKLFAWEGSPQAIKKYLGNRIVIGTVQAANDQDALSLWRSRPPSA